MLIIMNLIFIYLKFLFFWNYLINRHLRFTFNRNIKQFLNITIQNEIIKISKHIVNKELKSQEEYKYFNYLIRVIKRKKDGI